METGLESQLEMKFKLVTLQSVSRDPAGGVVPSERNPVRTKAVFDLMEHIGFRSVGISF